MLHEFFDDIVEQGDILICHTPNGAIAIPRYDDPEAQLMAYREAIGLSTYFEGAFAKEQP